jgi:hypothetical protein
MSPFPCGSPRFLSIVGARPNLVKMAPVVAGSPGRLSDARHVVVHAGQHYDPLLSEVFIDELGIPPPTTPPASAPLRTPRRQPAPRSGRQIGRGKPATSR